MPQTKIRVFASLTDACGADTIHVMLPDSSTPADVRDAVAASFPNAQPVLARSRIAAGMEFVAEGSAIPAGVEIAIIPPVSGG